MSALAGSLRSPVPLADTAPLHGPPKIHTLDAGRADLCRLFLGKDLATKMGFASTGAFCGATDVKFPPATPSDTNQFCFLC